MGPRNNKITLRLVTSDLTRFTWWVPTEDEWVPYHVRLAGRWNPTTCVQRPVTAAGRSGEPGPVCPPVGRGSSRGRARAPTPPPTSVDNPAVVRAATTNSALGCPAAAVGERLRWWWCFLSYCRCFHDDRDGGIDNNNNNHNNNDNNNFCIELYYLRKFWAHGVVQYHNTNCSNSHQNQYNDK